MTKTKKIIDIEIQVEPEPGIKERIVYYNSKMVTEQIGSGRKYHELKRAINKLSPTMY